MGAIEDPESPWRRRRAAVNDFVKLHELRWDLSMAALALLYIGLGLFEDHPQGFLSANTVVPIEIAITVLFLAEFSLRFWAAPSRAAYLRRHWIDLLALLPAIRYLRFLRIYSRQRGSSGLEWSSGFLWNQIGRSTESAG